MSKRLKHRLPLIAELNHLSLLSGEIITLKDLVKDLDSQFASVFEVNKKLCGINHILAKDAYANFFQIPLTDNQNNVLDTSIDDCQLIHEDFNIDGIYSGVKRKKNSGLSTESPFNELEYTKQTNFYLDNKQLFDTIFSRFLGKPARSRLVKLEAGTIVSPHIDYDPSYAVRVIIPIISPEECVNIFWQKGVAKIYHLNEGTAYFLNTGFKHAVVNMGKEDRYTLLISVNTSKDIDHIIEKDT